MPAEPFTLPVEKGSVIPINEDPTDGSRDFDYFPGYVGQQVQNLATGSLYVSTGVTADDWITAGVASGIPQGGPLSETLDADGNTITNLPDPSGAQDADTQAARDAAIAASVFDGGTVHHTIIVDPTGADEPSLKIGESTEPPDDGTHSQLYTDGGELKLKKEDNSVVTVGGGGSQPQLTADCADNSSGIDPTTGTLDPLSNGGTIDGVTLIDGTRVLLLSQGDQTQNGIWIAHVGAWTRPADFSGTLSQPIQVYVSGGTLLLEIYAQLVNANDPTLAVIVDTDPTAVPSGNAGYGTGPAFVGSDLRNIGRDQTLGGVALQNPSIVGTPWFNQGAEPGAFGVPVGLFSVWFDPTHGAAAFKLIGIDANGSVVRASIPAA